MILPSGHEVRFDTTGHPTNPVVSAFVGKRRIGGLLGDKNLGGPGRILAFRVEEGMSLRPSLFGRLRGQKDEELSLRNFGIGSILLELFMAQCREDRMKLITAGFLQSELDETPHLLGWFRRRGFQIEDPDESCKESSVKMAIWRNPERLFV